MAKKEIEFISRGVCLKRGHILLCRNKKHGNVYLPGGHVDWGEDSRMAAEREWMEELGVRCRGGRFLGVVEQQFESRGKKVCEISLFFKVTCFAITAKTDPPSAEKHIEFFWAPLYKLAAADLKPACLATLLPKWLADHSWAAKHWKGYTP